MKNSFTLVFSGTHEERYKTNEINKSIRRCKISKVKMKMADGSLAYVNPPFPNYKIQGAPLPSDKQFYRR